MKDTQLRCSRSSRRVDHARRRSGCAAGSGRGGCVSRGDGNRDCQGRSEARSNGIERLLMAETARLRLVLVRMADCYQKLGDAQARQIFEQVVRDYADQKDAVAIARTRLTALAQQSPSARIQRGDSSSTGRPAVHMRCPRDGRSLVRYNTDQRTFELVEIGSGQVRPLLTQGPNPDQAAVRGGGHIHLSNDGRKLAAVVGVRNATPAGAPSAERLELRVFDVGGRGDGRAPIRIQQT